VYHALLDDGVYLAPSAWEVGFLSAAHTDSDVDTLVAALQRAIPAHLPGG
jgi:glutamate-1-semialdehyde 2,1-aminomutase